MPTDEQIAASFERVLNVPTLGGNRTHAETRNQIFGVLRSERLEKLKTLRPRLLILDPAHPESSPDLKAMEDLYMSNLVPEEALEALEDEDYFVYQQAVDRGGMLNKFEPAPQEIKEYERHGRGPYETVSQQVMADLLGTSGRPGTYHVMGMFDPQGKMCASLSFRLPPRPQDYPDAALFQTALQEYIAFQEKQLLDSQLIKSQQMKYGRWDLERMRAQLPNMWEFDTVNVRKGSGGAAPLCVRNVIEFIKDHMGDLPEAVYCYRFNGLASIDESGQNIFIGRNRASHDLLEDIGFIPIATKEAQDEVVVRMLEEEQCHVFKPSWTYLHNGRNRMQRQLMQYMRQLGIGEDVIAATALHQAPASHQQKPT